MHILSRQGDFMVKKSTAMKRAKGTIPFSSQILIELNNEFKERAKAERRSIRVVLEQALRHYMDTVPLDGPAKSAGDGK